MSKRLTVHLKNVQKVNVEGKSKIFNTLSFRLRKGDAKEVNDILGSAGEVQKHYLSNAR